MESFVTVYMKIPCGLTTAMDLDLLNPKRTTTQYRETLHPLTVSSILVESVLPQVRCAGAL